MQKWEELVLERQDGYREGERCGEKRGEKRGEKQGRLNVLVSLVKDNILTKEDAAIRANMSVEEFETNL